MYENELKIAKELAIEAGKAIMEIYKDESLFNVEYKSDNSPLTAADKASNEIIIAGLKKYFPNYAILSEEEKDNKERLNNPYCFVVDPLDGTKEFIKRNGQFTVNIGLAVNHKSVMGIIYVPVSKELYFASENKGSFLQKADGQVAQMHVSDNVDVPNLRVVASSSHNCPEMTAMIEKYHWQNLIQMGSSLKGCLIASGKADVYFRYNPTMEWDTCAMQCIIEQAGGIFKQMDNSFMLYNRENNLNDKGFYAINNINNFFVE